MIARKDLAALPGLLAVGLMLVWAVHNGGYDADTWYWGALVFLAIAGTLALGLGSRLRLSRLGAIALGAFGLYVAWSYLSIAWAASPGAALEGSNKALLYLLVFTLMLALPWTPRAALAALVVFAIGVGVIAVVLLFRLASADHVEQLVVEGRLAAPTGYINATAALFTIGALVATALSVRRELPLLLRALLIAFACADLQLALIVQSRGWLFTLPLVLLVAIAVLPDRLRVLAAAVLPAIAVLAPLKRFLHVYQAAPGPQLNHAAAQAGKAGLVACGAMLLIGGAIAWGEGRARPRKLSPTGRRALGAVIAALTVGIAVAGGVIATHGRPFHFIAREWRGFSHTQTGSSSSSHFTDVGSGRYDIWRVSIDAFLAHPVGGLGQDNFGEYYLAHRHTAEEPSWTHSIELRLLTHTGIVGFVLFAVFMIAAITAAIRARRTGDTLERGVAGTALLAVIVWLIHGSIDWFWEMPALSGPALGFLGMAGSFASSRERAAVAAGAYGAPQGAPAARGGLARGAFVAGGTVAFAAALLALGFSYLSVREVSIASNVRSGDPSAALHDLSLAADFNPLDATPGRLAGAIALQSGKFEQAADRFDQATSRDPGDWFSWLGAGLAASARGDRTKAHRDFQTAVFINATQPADTEALARVYTSHPLTPSDAIHKLLVAR